MDLNTAMHEFFAVSASTAPSPHSQRQYRMVLARFASFCGDAPATPESISRYLAGLRVAGMSDASVAAHDRVLRLFFRRGQEMGWWAEDPMRRVRRQGKPKRLPKLADLSTFGAMVGAGFGGMCRGDVQAVRDLAILLLLAESGCRAGEVAGLRCADLDLPASSAMVEGKGRQTRFVLFGPVTRDALATWIDVRQQLRLDGEFVFPGLSRRGPMTPSGISQACHRLALAAGVARRPHRAHAFRHLFASSYVAAGNDLETLRMLMGHSEISTTQRYLWTDPATLRTKAGNGSPLTRLLAQSG